MLKQITILLCLVFLVFPVAAPAAGFIGISSSASYSDKSSESKEAEEAPKRKSDPHGILRFAGMVLGVLIIVFVKAYLRNRRLKKAP